MPVGAGIAVAGVGMAVSAKSASKANKSANRAIDAQTHIAQQQVDLANEQWERFKTQYGPVEQAVTQRALEGPQTERYENEAGADVSQAFARKKAIRERELSASGMDPTSGRALALGDNDAIEEAKAQAFARTAAGNRAEDIDYSRKVQALSLGKGLPTDAAAGLGQAGNTLGNVAKLKTDQANMFAGLSGQAGYAVGRLATQQYSQPNSTGVINNPSANQQSSGWTPEQAAAYDGTGNVSDTWFADGGAIRGPGTGTSDSIPAVNRDSGQALQVSDGEFIVPADVVRAKGEEFFHKLIEKYHKQVNPKPQGKANGGAISGLPAMVERAIHSAMPRRAL